MKLPSTVILILFFSNSMINVICRCIRNSTLIDQFADDPSYLICRIQEQYDDLYAFVIDHPSFICENLLQHTSSLEKIEYVESFCCATYKKMFGNFNVSRVKNSTQFFSSRLLSEDHNERLISISTFAVYIFQLFLDLFPNKKRNSAHSFSHPSVRNFEYSFMNKTNQTITTQFNHTKMKSFLKSPPIDLKRAKRTFSSTGLNVTTDSNNNNTNNLLFNYAHFVVNQTNELTHRKKRAGIFLEPPGIFLSFPFYHAFPTVIKEAAKPKQSNTPKYIDSHIFLEEKVKSLRSCNDCLITLLEIVSHQDCTEINADEQIRKRIKEFELFDQALEVTTQYHQLQTFLKVTSNNRSSSVVQQCYTDLADNLFAISQREGFKNNVERTNPEKVLITRFLDASKISAQQYLSWIIKVLSQSVSCFDMTVGNSHNISNLHRELSYETRKKTKISLKLSDPASYVQKKKAVFTHKNRVLRHLYEETTNKDTSICIDSPDEALSEIKEYIPLISCQTIITVIEENFSIEPLMIPEDMYYGCLGTWKDTCRLDNNFRNRSLSDPTWKKLFGNVCISEPSDGSNF